MKGITALILLNAITFISCFKIPETVSNYTIKSTGCQIDIKQLPLNTPLLISLTTRNIIYPDLGGSIINLPPNQEIELACPGSSSIQGEDFIATGEIVRATCISGLQFEIVGNLVELDSVLCSSSIRGTAIDSGTTCWGKWKKIRVGFQIPDPDVPFLEQYTSCFDSDLRNVIYSYFVMSKHIGDAITGGSVPTWAEDNFYNLGERVNNIYPKVAQRATINKLLGLSEDSIKYVNSSGENYIAKGHLIARTDYNYNAQQRSTYNYINSAPQWQSFNARNWYYFERNLRIYAANNLVDLEVYTGTYGITTLPHEITGEDVELYLYVDDNGNKAIPVPELFWKLAYDPLNKIGIVVLGINNPYQIDIEKSIICNDVSDDLTWLTFDWRNEKYGYLYACTIEDFKNVVDDIPEFDVLDILN